MKKLIFAELVVVLLLSPFALKAAQTKPIVHPIVVQGICADGETLISIGGVLYCCAPGRYICRTAV